MKHSLLLAALASTSLFIGSPASAQTPAAPGPALAISAAQLNDAMTCTGPLTGLTRDPVLLTPAFSSAAQSYGFGYLRQLPAIGITTCALTVPRIGYGDLQSSAEYVVAAVRLMNAQSGRKIALIGHQHGALNELWALTFWPDIAGKVSDLISLATPYQGTVAGTVLCGAHICAPAAWQITKGSKFLAAMNTRFARTGLPAGPSYTSIATAFDEVIIPQPQVSQLPGATNILLQNICPLRPVEHFSMLLDNLAYELVVDALDNPGPANPNRLPSNICFAGPFMPGTGTLQNAKNIIAGAAGAAAGAVYGVAAEGSLAEPELRPYAR